MRNQRQGKREELSAHHAETTQSCSEFAATAV